MAQNRRCSIRFQINIGAPMTRPGCVASIAWPHKSQIVTGRLLRPLNPNVEAHWGRAAASFICGNRCNILEIATMCISEVPGFVKQVSTPPAISVRIRLSAPFILVRNYLSQSRFENLADDVITFRQCVGCPRSCQNMVPCILQAGAQLYMEASDCE